MSYILGKAKSEIWDWFKTIFIALVVVFGIRAFIASPVLVDGESMMPTLEHADRLIVNKIGPTLSGYDRFDIVVFEVSEDTNYIKRVIGLPGDHIAYQDDVLYVNGEAYDEPYLDAYKANLPADMNLTSDFTLEEVTGEMEVPEGTLFVMGDNRQNSTDSRFSSVGFVSEEKLMGTTKIIFWPFKNIGLTD